MARATREESLSITGSTYPCIFKFGAEFYDFTPFKIVRNVWPAVNILPDQITYQNYD